MRNTEHWTRTGDWFIDPRDGECAWTEGKFQLGWLDSDTFKWFWCRKHGFPMIDMPENWTIG